MGQDEQLSYLGLNEFQFRFLAKEISSRGEPNAKLQVAVLYRKLRNIEESDIEIIRKLSSDKHPYTKRMSKATLDFWKDNNFIP